MSRKLMATVALAVVGCLIGAGTLYAQGFGGALSQAACADDGAGLRWAIGILGASVGASALANLRRRLPPGLVRVVDIVALNLCRSLTSPSDAGKTQAAPPSQPPSAA